MILENRIISSISSVLTDHSVALNDYASGTSTLVLASTDAVYIGSDLPFNHRWVKVGTANTNASIASVATWNGAQWVNCAEVIDQTAVAGKTLAQSGIISWVPDRFTAWGEQNSTEDMADLASLKIYYLYWARIKVSATLSAGTALAYVDHKFSEDADLYASYPDLDSADLLDAYKTGKTSWEEQAVRAAEHVIKDLKAMGIVRGSGGVLDWNLLRIPAAHKTAEIIFAALGQDYREELKQARIAYKEALNVRYFNADKNRDGSLSPQERESQPQHWLTR